MLSVLDNGILPVIRGTLTPLSFGGEIIAIMMLIPYLSPSSVARKSAVYAVLIVGLIE
jgi:spore germination protein KB